MSKLALDHVLEEYRAQRRYREAKRNEYLRRFEVLRQNYAHIHHHYPSHLAPHPTHPHNYDHTQPRHQGPATSESLRHSQQQHHVHSHGPTHSETHHEHHRHIHGETLHSHRVEENREREERQAGEKREAERKRLEGEQLELVQENEALKKKLVAIETEERDRLQAFKAEIETVRNKYLEEIKKLSDAAKVSKEQVEAKIHKIKTQGELAQKKNLEIEQTNRSLKAQIGEGNALMGQYATEIKKEYAQKIGEFEKIFNSSNEKIEAMEKEFNEDEFIENTLKNEELLKSIEENAEKAEEAGKILEDYQTLLEGKKEILTQINSNVEMKEREIEKMIELESKMKLIMDKLTSEKKIYVAENNKMAEELLEIKNLLVGVMNESK